VQEYIRIFPSKFNYNKKLPLINTVVPLSFCESKGVKKNRILNSFFFLIKRRIFLYYNITTSKFTSVRVYLYKEFVIDTMILNLVRVFVFQELEN
jgi:hypothetical protein